MRSLMITKLARLEAKRKPVPALRDPAVENARSDMVCDQIRESLLSFGVVQESRESLAETYARFLGINGRELQKLLATSCDEN